MKYLLSILILFSGFSFADNQAKKKIYSNYLICDEPYIFYPSLEERWLIGFDDESGSFFSYSDKYLELGSATTSVLFLQKEIKFEFGIGPDLILDRRTLKLSLGRQCKKVSENEFFKEITNLTEFAFEQKEKRKI
tara:strand:- start:239 stop:643 length:405 start_codon:yes stop_codon:yes gene_type:complete